MPAGVFSGFESGLVEGHEGSVGCQFFQVNHDLGWGVRVDCFVPVLAHDDEMGFCEYEKLASFFKDFIVIEGVPGVKRSTDLRVKFEELELVAVGGEPLGRVFAVGPSLVDEVARGFEFSGDDEVVKG